MRRLALLVAACVAATSALALPGPAAAGQRLLGVAADVGAGARAVAPGRAVKPARAHAAAAGLPYGGGPVLHQNRTHLIFWQPAGSGLRFEPGYIPLVERFLAEVASDSHDPGNVYGLTGQYTDSRGPAVYSSVYGGAVLDTTPLPANGCAEPPVTGPGWTYCVDDDQIESEVIRVIHADRLPTDAGDVYFLVTPNGLGSCEGSGPDNCALGGSANGSFCGYHSATPDGEILYADIPYNAVPGHCQSDNPRPNGSTADPTISTLSHEHNEMITDPLGGAWVDQDGNEDGDLCISSFGPPVGGSGSTAWNEVVGSGHFYLQEEYSDENGGCAPRVDPNTLSLAVKALRSKRAHGLALGAHGHDPHGRFVGYRWELGDGRSASGRLVHHHYRRAGRYRVVLRGTDSAGNYTYATRTVVVR